MPKIIKHWIDEPKPIDKNYVAATAVAAAAAAAAAHTRVWVCAKVGFRVNVAVETRGLEAIVSLILFLDKEFECENEKKPEVIYYNRRHRRLLLAAAAAVSVISVV